MPIQEAMVSMKPPTKVLPVMTQVGKEKNNSPLWDDFERIALCLQPFDSTGEGV